MMLKRFIAGFLLSPLLTMSQVSALELNDQDGLMYHASERNAFTGTAVTYSKDGSLRSSLDYKNGLPDGEYKAWYLKDKLMLEGTLKKGKRNGLWKSYYENGKVKMEVPFISNFRDGNATKWYESGYLMAKATYTNGRLDGNTVSYYENGQKRDEGMYVKGRREGKWIAYDETGQVTQKEHFLNGNPRYATRSVDGYLNDNLEAIASRDYKGALNNLDMAEKLIWNKSTSDREYMDVLARRAITYAKFYHYLEGENILLNAYGLTKQQIKILNDPASLRSADKINSLIQDLDNAVQDENEMTTAIVVSLCYNLLNDSVRSTIEQEHAMHIGQLAWAQRNMVALYSITASILSNYDSMPIIEKQLQAEPASDSLLLLKARLLAQTEQFKAADSIAEICLKKNENNREAL